MTPRVGHHQLQVVPPPLIHPSTHTPPPLPHTTCRGHPTHLLVCVEWRGWMGCVDLCDFVVVKGRTGSNSALGGE